MGRGHNQVPVSAAVWNTYMYSTSSSVLDSGHIAERDEGDRDVNKAGSFKAKAKSLKAKARSLKAKARHQGYGRIQ